MLSRFACFLLLVTGSLFARAAGPDIEIVTGESEGARFSIAAPAKPEARTGLVLVFCHGYRPEGGELLDGLLPLKSASAHLVEKGWVVASTSYRRNGLIVADALRDVKNLRAEIARRFGEPRRLILHGESMGGAIATLLVEREPKLFAGAVVVGAALQIEEGGKALAFSHAPGGPLIFLCNRSETKASREYIEAARSAPTAPVLLTVDRDGHVNVNQREIEAALAALNQWLEGGPAPKPADATLPPDPRPSAMDAIGGGGGSARLTQLNPLFGNITLDFQASDFAQLGVKPGATFQLKFGKMSVPVKLGQTYTDVPSGAWVAFFDAEDRLLVAINRGNAAAALGAQEGDLLRVENLP